MPKMMRRIKGRVPPGRVRLSQRIVGTRGAASLPPGTWHRARQ